MRQHPPFFAFSVEQRRGEEVDVTFGPSPNTSLRKVFYFLLSLQSGAVFSVDGDATSHAPLTFSMGDWGWLSLAESFGSHEGTKPRRLRGKGNRRLKQIYANLRKAQENRICEER